MMFVACWLHFVWILSVLSLFLFTLSRLVLHFIILGSAQKTIPRLHFFPPQMGFRLGSFSSVRTLNHDLSTCFSTFVLHTFSFSFCSNCACSWQPGIVVQLGAKCVGRAESGVLKELRQIDFPDQKCVYVSTPSFS